MFKRQLKIEFGGRTTGFQKKRAFLSAFDQTTTKFMWTTESSISLRPLEKKKKKTYFQ